MSGWDRRLFVAAVIIAVPAMAWAGIRLATREGGPSAVTVADLASRTFTDWGKQGPALMILSWDAGAGIVGVTETGAVHRSMDGGTTWASAGELPGSPQALLVTPDAWFAAAADPAGTTVIYRSGDAGRSWHVYYEADS